MTDQETVLVPTGDHAVLAQACPDDVTRFAVTADGHGITECAPDGLFAVATKVRKMGYRILSCLSAYNTKADGSGVFYSFVKPANTAADFADLRLRVHLEFADADGSKVNPKVQSLVDVFPAAGWHEREMFDMYGIDFVGNPDLRRMFLPDDWKGHPMRLDDNESEQYVMMDDDGEDRTVATEQEGAW